MKKAFAAPVITAGLALMGWFVYTTSIQRPATNGPPGLRGKGMAVAVETTPVERRTVRRIGYFTGSLSARSRFIVAPKVSGRLEKVTVDIGDSVQPGQLIARLEDDEYVQQVEQARAELAVANANVAESKSAQDMALRELDRVKALYAKKMAAETELDVAEARNTAAGANYKVALAEVARREAAFKTAEVRLAYTRVNAVWDSAGGARVVGERFVDEGAMLAPNTPIVSILDNSVLLAVIDVIERDYPLVKLGQKAAVTTDGYPGQEFNGGIARIAPLLKEASRQARVEIEIPNSDGLLKPGMFVRVRIEFDRHEDAVAVPMAALARRDGRQGVFLVDADEMKANFVPVMLGITDGDAAEVLDPPISGRVVTLGQHLLEDGAAVRIPEALQQEHDDTGGPGGDR
ncbi:MAG: efflux RND transporter periplasmic adaptor subunit [Planctomycetes bacterium]|nr:efflux RND transporter periplasmic adaptor subunit [Planctomycetota bacterium]